jgi:hypothetical protein
MKNQIKLSLVVLTIGMGVFACKGTVNRGDAGTTPPAANDSIKSSSDKHIDTINTSSKSPGDTAKVHGNF